MHTFYKIVYLIFAVGWVACSSPTAESYYRQGRQFRENDQPVEAMNAFISATRVHSREYNFKARSYSNMATMCRIAERHDLAYTLYEHSLHQFALANDTLAQAYALNNMAWEQAVTGNKSQVVQLIDSALTLSSDSTVQTKVLESRAAACLYAAEYDSVLFYIRKSPVQSEYFDILAAQAYTFLEINDSAVYYAWRVVAQTDNPRYLDDAVYILAHCNDEAEVEDIRIFLETRSDIQRELERNNPEWIQAMILAQNALSTPKSPMKSKIFLYIGISLAFVLALFLLLFLLRRRRRCNTLEQQCRALQKSPDLREELHWRDYTQFSTTCNHRLLGIVDKLEKRGLSEREIRLSVLVLIGLTYARMAEILIRAENGIGKDKYMVAKHLGVRVKDLQTALRRIAEEK